MNINLTAIKLLQIYYLFNKQKKAYGIFRRLLQFEF